MCTNSKNHKNERVGWDCLDKEVVMMEYNALRDEILKRIELRQQILWITLTLATAILSAGLIQKGQDYAQNDTSIALVFPPIAFCLALAWAQHSFRIRELDNYISENAKNTPYHQLDRKTEETTDAKGILGSLKFLIYSHGGAFLCTQLMAIIIGCSMFTWHGCNRLQWFLLGFDLVSIEAVVLVLWQLQNDGIWGDVKRFAVIGLVIGVIMIYFIYKSVQWNLWP